MNGARPFDGFERRIVARFGVIVQVWHHLKPGQRCRFTGTVVPYRRGSGGQAWTVTEITTLVVLSAMMTPPEA